MGRFAMDDITILGVEHILERWKSDQTLSPCLVKIETIPARLAKFRPIPADMHPSLADALRKQGIPSLYSHQLEAWMIARSGKNLVVVTGTASGKTLCYNLPVLDICLRQPDSRALYLFPTKALAQDQLKSLQVWQNHLHSPDVQLGIYDGDTPASRRQFIRTQTRLLLTNPDMLHTGMLPHHTLWADFWKNLRYIIIDEVHTYRGVFGSHVANLLRRVKRVAEFYGAYPQFLLTSATIANPGELSSHLIESPVEVIDMDGSPAGERHLVLYNPPIVDTELGLRASAFTESLRLAGDLLHENLQTIVFIRSRYGVELALRYLRESNPDNAIAINGYRSGYLPLERREIEASLRQGLTRLVAATNALELGIDIGSLSASLLVGFPGTIASMRQQIGRAGRKNNASLAVLVASASPLDQFLMQHPEYILDRSPELGLIDPNNLLILLQHIRCAAFELPFNSGDRFGNLDPELLGGLVDVLVQAQEMHQTGGKYFWMADQYPAAQVSLRSSSPKSISLRIEGDDAGQRIGEVDWASACWMVHPNAIYLHNGQTYLVKSLDLDNTMAWLKPSNTEYYTEPVIKTTVEKLAEIEGCSIPGGTKFFGEIQVTSQVTAYRKVSWYTHEYLGGDELTLPPSELRTTACWFVVHDTTINQLREQGLWSNDPNDYGANWQTQRRLALLRDNFTCKVCGSPERGRPHHVHHKKAFRTFTSYEDANLLDNLITLCPNCHKRVEIHIHMRSGLAGLSYVLHNLSPLHLMCDQGDLGMFAEPQSTFAGGQSVIVFYDLVPAGIGLSKKLYEIERSLFSQAQDLVSSCPCKEGCPTCVGPAGENGVGGKSETRALLVEFNKTLKG
jgi:DEAD/DEAH box helicase domain-containing protein